MLLRHKRPVSRVSVSVLVSYMTLASTDEAKAKFGRLATSARSNAFRHPPQLRLPCEDLAAAAPEPPAVAEGTFRPPL